MSTASPDPIDGSRFATKASAPESITTRGERIEATLTRAGGEPSALAVSAICPSGSMGTFTLRSVPHELRPVLDFCFGERVIEDGIASFLRIAEKKGLLAGLVIERERTGEGFEFATAVGAKSVKFTITRDRRPETLAEAVDGDDHLKVKVEAVFPEPHAPVLSIRAVSRDGAVRSLSVEVGTENAELYSYEFARRELLDMNLSSRIDALALAFMRGGEKGVEAALEGRKAQWHDSYQSPFDPNDADEVAHMNGIFVGDAPSSAGSFEKDCTRGGTEVRYAPDGPIFTYAAEPDRIRMEVRTGAEEGATTLTLIWHQGSAPPWEHDDTAKQAKRIFEELKLAPIERRMFFLDCLVELGFETNLSIGCPPEFIRRSMTEMAGFAARDGDLRVVPPSDSRAQLQDTLAGITRCEIVLPDARRDELGTLVLRVNRRGYGCVEIEDGVAGSATARVGAHNSGAELRNLGELRELISAFLDDPERAAERFVSVRRGSSRLLPSSRNEDQAALFSAMGQLLDDYTSVFGTGTARLRDHVRVHSDTCAEFRVPEVKGKGIQQLNLFTGPDGVGRIEVVVPGERWWQRLFGFSVRYSFQLDEQVSGWELQRVLSAVTRDEIFDSLRELPGTEHRRVGNLTDEGTFSPFARWLGH